MKLETRLEDKYIEVEIENQNVILSIYDSSFPEDPDVVMILNEYELLRLIQFLKAVLYMLKSRIC